MQEKNQAKNLRLLLEATIQLTILHNIFLIYTFERNLFYENNFYYGMLIWFWP
jgi:hypothetical protein